MDRFNDIRSSHSEERENGGYSKMNKYKTNTLPIDGGRERCVSMPSGHYAATATSSNPATLPNRNLRGKSPGAASSGGSTNKSGGERVVFQHYGSSLSLSNGSSTSDLTSRTLRPPSPTTLKKSSLPGRKPAKAGPSRPSLPSLNSVELRSPKLADYLEKPRMVSMNDVTSGGSHSLSRAAASEHHAKRMNAGNYRNLRLGNFIESGESNEEELIPERLRAYYLDTYLNVCDTCESKTHLDPTSPIQRGM